MRIDDNLLDLAIKQFILDCNIEEYNKEKKVFIGEKKANLGARLYTGKTLEFKAIVCLGQAFIMAGDSMKEWVLKEYADEKAPEWMCNFDTLRKLERQLNSCGMEIEDTHIYFLPDKDYKMVEPMCDIKVLSKEEILKIKGQHSFNKALCYNEDMPDVIAIAALEGDKMIGMAGASQDGKYLWQIGIDVLPEYRNKGLAVNLTALIKQEIIKMGVVPFYGTSESHSVSQSVAVKAGFLPAWAEIYVREKNKKKW